MKSFIQTPELVLVNGLLELTLENFLKLVPEYSLHTKYTQVQYVPTERVTYVEGNSATNQPDLLDDDLRWSLGDSYIEIVEAKANEVEVPIEEVAPAPRSPKYAELITYLAASKKDRKLMLIAMPLLADKEFIKDLIKRFRNTLLAKSDWSIMPDYPFTDEERAPWIAYRKALRDYMNLIKDKEILDLPQFPIAP
jgi:hypothetical protein